MIVCVSVGRGSRCDVHRSIIIQMQASHFKRGRYKFKRDLNALKLAVSNARWWLLGSPVRATVRRHLTATLTNSFQNVTLDKQLLQCYSQRQFFLMSLLISRSSSNVTCNEQLNVNLGYQRCRSQTWVRRLPVTIYNPCPYLYPASNRL